MPPKRERERYLPYIHLSYSSLQHLFLSYTIIKTKNSREKKNHHVLPLLLEISSDLVCVLACPRVCFCFVILRCRPIFSPFRTSPSSVPNVDLVVAVVLAAYLDESRCCSCWSLSRGAALRLNDLQHFLHTREQESQGRWTERTWVWGKQPKNRPRVGGSQELLHLSRPFCLIQQTASGKHGAPRQLGNLRVENKQDEN